MSVGFSIFLIALGAILTYAITRGRIGPVEIHVVGTILMIVGAIGLVFSLLYMFLWAPRRRADREIVHERERL
jgi:Co/Zn/Cd efflux system component